jgi:hypothetical protein
MSKYRIVKMTNPALKNEVRYQIEKKFLWWWGTISFDEYTGFITFKTAEEAAAFIIGGCKDPTEIKKEVIQYIEIKEKWPNGSAKVMETE